MNDEAPKMNKAERLAVASVVAPFIRENADIARRRVVKKYDQKIFEETGKLEATGFTTWAEVIASQMRRHALEIDVQPGVRRTETFCIRCKKPFPLHTYGRATSVLCDACKDVKCVDCKVRLSASACRSRQGDVKRCKGCHSAYMRAARDDAKERTPRTHCRRGHEQTENNIIVRRSGARVCRTCTNDRKRAARLARKKAA